MAAPGALTIAKTILPETVKSKASWDEIRNMPTGLESLTFFLTKSFSNH